MPPQDSGPSRSYAYRGRSRSPDYEASRRGRDRQISSRDERREEAPRSPSRSERRNADRERRRSSRDRGNTYDEKYRPDKPSRKDYSPSPLRSRRQRHSSSISSSSASSGREISRERKHSKKSSRKRSSSSSSYERSPSRKHSRKSKTKRSHKNKHRSSSLESSDDDHRKKESRSERKERKRRKREMEEKKKSKKAHSSKHKSAVQEYGKYGIITEADMFTKDQEFRAWMVEEKMLNPETVPQAKMKELFKVYMEDYNTATLPHEKYYALEKYEARMEAIRSGNIATQADTYDPRADEAALAAQHKRVAKTDGEVYIGRAQLEQLRRIERERVEASRMKRMGMEVKESMGVRYEAN